jgi:hypothetical protein
MEKNRKLAKRILAGLITEARRRKISQYLKDRSRTSMIRQVSKEDESHLDDILRNSLNHIRLITAPLALITQIQHAGGDFLNRFFDGHPEIHALPHELTVGTLDSGLRSEFELNSNQEDLIENLYGDIAGIQQKFKRNHKDRITLPFLFLPLVQEQIFLKFLGSSEAQEKRKVYEAYITACFGAWLDYQNCSGDKKFTTACGPAVAMQQNNIEGFLEIYPDGKLIYLIRNPQSWYSAALQAEPEKYADVKKSVKYWKAGLRSALKARERFADHTCLIKVEDLLGKTEKVMRHLAKFLGLQYDPILSTPTFNGDPVSVERRSIMETVAINNSKSGDHLNLDQSTLKLIEKLTKRDYQKILREIIRF